MTSPKWRRSVTWKIYLNHILSSWGDRMWDFSVGLYLVILYPESLILTSILGFSMCSGVIIFGSYLGKWVDRNPRFRVATTGILVQNLFVIQGSILLALNLQYQSEITTVWSGYLQYLLYTLVIISAVLANLGSITSDMAIERDWIVVLSAGDENKLSTLNSTMRSIDLTTNILAPVVMGQIIYFGSPLAGTVFIASWNFISFLLEYYLLKLIYNSVPELAEKKEGSENGGSSGAFINLKESFLGWRVYFRHPIRFAGIAFALLFMTVMGFDSITLGYIYSQGGSESFIGIVTSIGAIFGILASLAFPYARSHLGKYSTGNIGFGLNILFLLFCLGSVFGQGSPFNPEAILHPFASLPVTTQTHETKPFLQLWRQDLNVFYFVFGIVLARFGLWLADLSVTQIMQESVEESLRGVVNGVQNSLNQLVNLLKFFLIICLPSVQAFGYLIFASWIACFLAWMFFIYFVCTRDSLSTYPSMDSLDESRPLLKLKLKRDSQSPELATGTFTSQTSQPFPK